MEKIRFKGVLNVEDCGMERILGIVVVWEGMGVTQSNGERWCEINWWTRLS